MMDEMVSMDGLVDSVSKIRASTDLLKSIRFFGHFRKFHWSFMFCLILWGLRVLCGSLSTRSTPA